MNYSFFVLESNLRPLMNTILVSLKLKSYKKIKQDIFNMAPENITLKYALLKHKTVLFRENEWYILNILIYFHLKSVQYNLLSN